MSSLRFFVLSGIFMQYLLTYLCLLFLLTEKVLPANRAIGVDGVDARSFRVRLAAHRVPRRAIPRRSSSKNVTPRCLAATSIARHIARRGRAAAGAHRSRLTCLSAPKESAVGTEGCTIARSRVVYGTRVIPSDRRGAPKLAEEGERSPTGRIGHRAHRTHRTRRGRRMKRD